MEWSDPGFKFTCLTDEVDFKHLPKGMINIEKGKKMVKFTSHELVRSFVGSC